MQEQSYILHGSDYPRRPQHVNDLPHYFYAGFWIRAYAFIIDLICISLVTGSTIGLVYHLAGLEKNSSIITIYGILSLIIYLGYFTLLTKLNHGQTLGKMIFGIRVVSFDETELSWQTVLIRETACRFILKTGILMVGYLVAAFTPKKQHVGDFLSNTSVVTINLLKAQQETTNLMDEGVE
ncbi:RDD family protein [Vagococcus penaei]|uniref:RDD family protein n=1 Tax=Vagococcus penaei TaxID=633807 RepID=UPI001E642AAA|nr:RDD family protein [Vagococcus penaei]